MAAEDMETDSNFFPFLISLGSGQFFLIFFIIVRIFYSSQLVRFTLCALKMEKARAKRY